MATTSKQMASTAAATSSTTLYTAPSSTGAVAVVTNIVVANTSGSSQTFNISLNGVALATSTAIPANSTAFFDIKQVLNASQTITGYASATSVNFLISGVEIV
jgi:hypothetical protein